MKKNGSRNSRTYSNLKYFGKIRQIFYKNRKIRLDNNGNYKYKVKTASE